jgi:deoxycytidine triphosphate deaminase
MRHVGKRRTREHVIADMSACFVEWQALQCGYVVERMVHDYGIDLELKTFNERGQRERGDILVQVKATDGLVLRPRQTAFSFRIERTNLVDWLYEREPVILIVFDAVKKRGYWICIQEYFGDPKNVDFFAMGKSTSVRVPVANRLNPSAIRKMATLRDQFRLRRSNV